MAQFTKAAITKCHQPGGLDHRNVSSHSSGGYKSESRCRQGHCPLGTLRDRLSQAPLQLLVTSGFLARTCGSPHLHFTLLVYAPICVSTFPFYKDTSRAGSGALRMTSSYFEVICAILCSNKVCSQVLRTRTPASLGDTIRPTTLKVLLFFLQGCSHETSYNIKLP